MQTTLYQITTHDGRVFRIFTANKNQFNRLMRAYTQIKTNTQANKHTTPTLEVLSNGIHNITQFEKFISIIN